LIHNGAHLYLQAHNLDGLPHPGDETEWFAKNASAADGIVGTSLPSGFQTNQLLT
jgi:hypothetical protein